jgi:hypothetical protein
MNVCANLNFLAVFTATILYFMLGALWYSKALFGPRWGQLHNIDFNANVEKSKMVQIMGTSFVMMLIAVWALAVVSNLMGISTWMGGMKLGLLCGVCFSAASIAITNVYLQKKLPLYFIDGGYHVVGYTIASVILAVWK